MWACRVVNHGLERTCLRLLREHQRLPVRRLYVFFFQAEDGIRDIGVTGVQTCALPISLPARTAVPGSPGVTEATTADTIVLAYNDRAAVREAFARYGAEIACLVTEAACGNMGVVPPGVEDGIGFNAFLAEICAEHGALFVSDEVMTGFRISRSGQYGHDGVTPDLMTFGKVMGGGFPAAAFGGRRELMQHLAPVGGVYQAGTLSGNPVATAAGLATLALADEDAYARLDQTACRLRDEVHAALDAAGVAHVIQAAGNLFSVFFVGEGVTRVPDYATAACQLTPRYS